MIDSYLVESWAIPGTAFAPSSAAVLPEYSLESRIGQVTNHIVLTNVVIFITHLNKIFAYVSDNFQITMEPVELTTFYQSTDDFKIEDIQGSFNHFGIITRSGCVLIGYPALLNNIQNSLHNSTPWDTTEPNNQPRIVPALQNSSVISLAFGDYHFLALHADGSISSYGRESRGCGALGLGPKSIANMRGVKYTPNRFGIGDGRWEPAPWSNGRRTIWFEYEKLEWMTDLSQPDPEADDRIREAPVDSEMTDVLGEWFEREGQAWDQGPQGNSALGTKDGQCDSTKAFSALKVAAAGWHSGALVLVDTEKAEKIRRKYVCKSERGNIPIDENHASTKTQVGKDTTFREHVTTTVAAAGMLLFRLGRWFLGLTERDAMTSSEAAGPGASNHSEKYVWHDQPFPRLRLPSGSAMPGERPLTAWKGGEPDFTSHLTNDE